MIKLLLITQNSEHTGKIQNICKEKGIVLETYPVFELLNLNVKSFEVVIIDISGLEVRDNDYYRDFFSKVNTFSASRLLILDPGQASTALKINGSMLKLDEIIFSDRIEEEFYTRVAFILSITAVANPGNCIIFGGLVLNLDKYELSINNSGIELTFKEYELLKLFLENPNKVFSRNKLLSIIWGYDFYGGSRTVDVHMRRLRSKLIAPYIDMLKTVRNVGYMFSPGSLQINF